MPFFFYFRYISEYLYSVCPFLTHSFGPFTFLSPHTCSMLALMYSGCWILKICNVASAYSKLRSCFYIQILRFFLTSCNTNCIICHPTLQTKTSISLLFLLFLLFLLLVLLVVLLLLLVFLLLLILLAHLVVILLLLYPFPSLTAYRKLKC